MDNMLMYTDKVRSVMHFLPDITLISLDLHIMSDGVEHYEVHTDSEV